MFNDTELLEGILYQRDRQVQLKKDIERLQVRLREAQKEEKQLTQQVLDYWRDCGVESTEFEHNDMNFVAKVRQGRERVVINCETTADIPDDFLRRTVKTEPDKELIKESIDCGDKFNWASVERGEPTIAIQLKG